MHGIAAAQSTIHQPVGTGDCNPHVGNDYNDASGIVWIALAQKWIMHDQRYFFVFSKDGVLERQSPSYVTCKGAAEHEGFTLVDSPRCSNDLNRRCYTSADCAAPATCTVAGPYSDVLWVQDENLGFRCTNNPDIACSDDFQCGGSSGQSLLCKGAGAMCRYSVDAILNMGQNGNPATPIALEEVWATSVPADSSEGLVFVPDMDSPGRYGGYFFWAEQAEARWRRFTLDPTKPTISWGAKLDFPPGCAIAGDLSDGYYDFVQSLFYSQSDGGNRYTVHSGDFSTCYVSVPDPPTCRSDSGYEALGFGGGKFAYTDDSTNHASDGYNGFWLFEDDYCGDDVKVSTETCDGSDLDSMTCATAAPQDCANGRCGPGWRGFLRCQSDCAAFDDSACTTISDVQKLRRTDVR